VFLVVLMAGYWFVAGLLPPPSANDSAQHIANFYRDHAHQLRAGMLIMLCGLPLMLPFQALITYQMKRHDPRLAPFAYTQLAAGLIVVLVFFFAIIFISVATFRPERDPQITQALNDVAFIIFVWPFSLVMAEYVPVGLAVLMDKSETPLYPRWVGWFELTIAAMFLPAAPTIFVKHGPFSWQGFFPFWLGFAAFGLWFAVMTVMALRAIDRLPQESAVAGAG
jgi:hypothetical protein